LFVSGTPDLARLQMRIFRQDGDKKGIDRDIGQAFDIFFNFFAKAIFSGTT
jgi:hypothetical protein